MEARFKRKGSSMRKFRIAAYVIRHATAIANIIMQAKVLPVLAADLRGGSLEVLFSEQTSRSSRLCCWSDVQTTNQPVIKPPWRS